LIIDQNMIATNFATKALDSTQGMAGVAAVGGVSIGKYCAGGRHR